MTTIAIDTGALGLTSLFLALFIVLGLIISRNSRMLFPKSSQRTVGCCTVLFFASCVYSLVLAAQGHLDPAIALTIFSAFGFTHAGIRYIVHF
jgi:CHASE2 domain-containing sensor protein